MLYVSYNSLQNKEKPYSKINEQNPVPDFPGRLDITERTEYLKKSLEKIPQKEKNALGRWLGEFG